MAGLAASPSRNTGTPARLAMRTVPAAIWRAGPRGPSGVTTRMPPPASRSSASRKAAAPPLSLPFFAEEPRIGGMLWRSMAREMNSPSGDREIRIRVSLWSITATLAVIERAMSPCQKQPIMPPGPLST